MEKENFFSLTEIVVYVGIMLMILLILTGISISRSEVKSHVGPNQVEVWLGPVF